jgi:hypothetical protein
MNVGELLVVTLIIGANLLVWGRVAKNTLHYMVKLVSIKKFKEII